MEVGRNMNKYFEDKLNFMHNVTYPYIYQIEVTDVCNLKCPACLNKDIKNKGFIDMKLLDMIIEKNYLRNTPYVELQMAGEPMLDAHIEKIVQKIKNTSTMVGLSTNLSLVDMRVFNILDAITISFDTFNEKEYEISRYPQKWNTFILNLTYFLENINKEVMVYIQLLLTKWTKNTFFASKKRLELFIKRFDKKNIFIRYVDDCFIENRNEKSNFKRERDICLNPFLSVSIKNDGTVVPCCFDFMKHLPLGNLYKQDLLEIWESKTIQELRKKHRKGKGLSWKCKSCYYRSPILLLQSFLADLVKFKKGL